MRAPDKAEILQLVRRSPLSIRVTLAQLGIPRSTYYAWQKRERLLGRQGLEDRKPRARRVWNELSKREVRTVLRYAHRFPDSSPRELAYQITDDDEFSVSESTVYRILKRYDLIRPAVVTGTVAAKQFHQQTTRVHQMWQTDYTYLFVHGWGWYYVGGIVDDYSRFLITYHLVRDMTGETTSQLVQQAVETTGMLDVPVKQKVRLLSDNGSGYISGPFNEYLSTLGIRHIFASRCHPQTCGKIERINRTAKERLRLLVYRDPQQLERALAEFRHWYNYERYHEAIGNVRPADVYRGRAQTILQRRARLKRRTLMRRRRKNLAIN